MPPDAPARRMVELHGVYEDGELRLPERLDLVDLKDARLKVVVRIPKGSGLLSREEHQDGAATRNCGRSKRGGTSG
ncbi:MAG: hypothetical protein DMG27_17080 [Acidobacteria bacterium]|nr:MAG: hypothetical protein DMG27_17080 [Acidobacteriota bacterium]